MTNNLNFSPFSEKDYQGRIKDLTLENFELKTQNNNFRNTLNQMMEFLIEFNNYGTTLSTTKEKFNSDNISQEDILTKFKYSILQAINRHKSDPLIELLNYSTPSLRQWHRIIKETSGNKKTASATWKVIEAV